MSNPTAAPCPICGPAPCRCPPEGKPQQLPPEPPEPRNPLAAYKSLTQEREEEIAKLEEANKHLHEVNAQVNADAESVVVIADNESKKQAAKVAELEKTICNLRRDLALSEGDREDARVTLEQFGIGLGEVDLWAELVRQRDAAKEEVAKWKTENDKLVDEMDEMQETIERHKSLYAAAIKTIADRDTLIAHIRDRYDWLRGECDSLVDCIHSPGVARRLRDVCEEPTP